MKRSERIGASLVLGWLVTAMITGCQMDVGGQTLPSPYYMTDDIQYFPPGPEFKLSREAAAMKAMQSGLTAPSGPIVAPPPIMAPGAAPVVQPPMPGDVVPPAAPMGVIP